MEECAIHAVERAVLVLQNNAVTLYRISFFFKELFHNFTSTASTPIRHSEAAPNQTNTSNAKRSLSINCQGGAIDSDNKASQS